MLTLVTQRTTKEEHRMAMVSALDILQKRPGMVSVEDVARSSGLVEIRAKRALEDLVKEGTAVKKNFKYGLK